MKKIITKYPLFLFLLPVFFVLHGYTENYNLVLPKDAVWLTLFYIGCTITITLLCWLIYRNFYKANLSTFILMSVYFFFGTIHDSLKDLFPDSFITKYVFLLPFLSILTIIIIILIKKSKSKFNQASTYLNTLFLVLLIFEILNLSRKIVADKPITVSLNPALIDCDSCATPDIYLIVADGYTNNTALKEVFSFDNSAFETALKNRNFHVINNSFSNYNATAYSITSMLNLNYLDNLTSLNDNIENLMICYETIKQNQTLLFLKKKGYRFYNFSDFNFPGQPAVTNPTFLLAKTRTITSQTLSGRIYRDLWYHLATDFKLKPVINKYVYGQLRNNEKVFKLTEEVADEKTSTPKLIYSHVVMPHNPYYFDKDGNPNSLEKLKEFTGSNRKDFIEYLQYANKKLLALVDEIKAKSANPPVIILMGDHGFRQFNDSTDKKYYFMNLSSIYMPDGNYSGFKDSSSLVNQMRTFLNNQFKQNLPLLNDSSIFIQQ